LITPWELQKESIQRKEIIKENKIRNQRVRQKRESRLSASINNLIF
jgi:hypothetical protein